MRVVAGRNGANHRGQLSPQDELERHADALARLAERAIQREIDAPVCTFVLRSAKSAPARALVQTTEQLAASGVAVKAILIMIEPEQELHTFFSALTALLPDGDLGSHIRWARNPRLMDAHEQAVYGPDLCWTGDAVRREADKRNRLVLFDEAPDALRRGAHAFKALWAATDPVPARLLNIHDPDGPVSAETCRKNAPLADVARPVEGWPLLRH